MVSQRQQNTVLLAGFLLAACLSRSNAFAPRPSPRLTWDGQQSVTPSKTFLQVSKTRIKEHEKTTTLSDDNTPFLHRIIPSFDAKEPQSQSPSRYPIDTRPRLKQLQKDDPSTNKGSNKNNPALFLGATAITLFITIAIAVTHYTDLSLADLVAWFHQLVAHPKETLEAGVDAVQAMGPAGVVVFGLIYCVAEILAVPATPLTLSAGYLFGLAQGTAVVLLAATSAACVAFFIGKTFLRTWVEETLSENPKFAKLDKAIGKEGFKLLLLVRLSPLFPFALSNYLYGASSVKFPSYFWGTLLGFAPGTVAYVYTGMVGKELTLGGGDSSQPWYVYAGGFALLATFVKLASDVASEIVEAIDDDDDNP